MVSNFVKMAPRSLCLMRVLLFLLFTGTWGPFVGGQSLSVPVQNYTWNWEPFMIFLYLNLGLGGVLSSLAEKAFTL